MNIVILSALTGELVPIRNHLTSVFKAKHDVQLDFLKIPVGLKSTDSILRDIQSGSPEDVWINAGTAGAISDKLQPLDIFFPSVFLNENNLAVTPRIPAELTGTMPAEWKTGILFSSREPVTSVRQRDEIAAVYRADAVDMETFVIAEACATEKISFLSLKVISDTADSDTAVIFRQNLKKSVEKLSKHLEILIDRLISI